jgi:hypothetical protein
MGKNTIANNRAKNLKLKAKNCFIQFAGDADFK